MQTLLHDLRYAVRQLRRNVAFSIAAVLTIALGIGVNIALFSVADEILLRPRPGVQNAKALVWITPMLPGGYPWRLAYPDFQDVREQTASLLTLTAMQDVSFALAGNDTPEIVHGQIVSSNYFSTLQTRLALGRGFTANEENPNDGSSVAVLSHALWKRRYNGDSTIVGRTILINGQVARVVGIAPQFFNGADQTDDTRELWIPPSAVHALFSGYGSVLANRQYTAFSAIGRIRDGHTAAEVQATVAALTGRFVAADSAGRAGMKLRMFSASKGFPPGSERNILPLALAASAVTALILLIAFSNVSNLLLGRGLSRRREIAIRLSLGAGRKRLVRQLVTENLLLTSIGGAAGILLATWCVDLVLAYAVPIPMYVHFDWRVIAFAIILTLMTGVLFGIIPAMDATRVALAGSMNGASFGATVKHGRIQNRFVVAQVALSLTLLVMSGLFLRSVTKAQDIDLGFDTSHSVVAVGFDLGLQGYSSERSEQFLNALAERATAHPGVQSTSVATMLPTTSWMQAFVISESAAAADPAAKGVTATQTSIRPEYFQTLGIPLVRGRDFNTRDVPGNAGVVIVSELLAAKLWPAGNAVGERLKLRESKTGYLTVVGVVKDVASGAMDGGKSAMVYLPQLQSPVATRFTLLVRAKGDAARYMQPLRADIRALDPNLPVSALETMAQMRDTHLLLQTRGSTVLGIFGALALLLAAIGVHAVMAFAVAQRTREIGVRVALGAEPLRVVQMVIGRGMKLVSVGVLVGVGLSLAMGKMLTSMLFGITPGDMWSYAGGCAVLFVAALLACWLPARRAAAVSPMVALRQEV